MTSVELRTARLEDQVQALETTQARLTRMVDSLNTLVAEQTDVVRRRRAENQERVTELERLIQSLQSELQTAQSEIRDLKDQIRYERGYGAIQPGMGAGPDKDSGLPPSGGTENSAPSTAPAPAPQTTPRSLYDAAYQDLTRGNHGLALMGFQEVLSQFPDSELADNAQYWIGETYYDQADYETALEEFRKVPVSYPTGDKVPAALLKAGFSLQALGHKQDACKAYRDLVDRFPGSEESRLAMTRLADFCGE
jgi:tol-pal system protein YbgF